ncbi:MAG: 30S ribosomal protein S13 [Thermoplasmata archaeon]|nr:MAG: 30S ribosomal protein S13 [Thermoplasmata archaeon]RLF36417.1 MAG: 30S ribosomal protein S13 [Thermoplasmata archaeon]RLF52299.1 MAG: 30S ribosomal protein S13 [Thermoplasmata archaeon]
MEETTAVEKEETEKDKTVEAEVKKEKTKGKKEDEDFKYIVRISNTDINGEKNLVYGLTTIKGIGVHMATLIADAAGIDRYTKIGDLKDSEIEKLQMIIDNVNKNAPGWMVNHRKDYETGEDIHLVGSDIDMKLRDEINIMKKIRSYRGIRHERGLPVRGQRTRSNNRKGLALGVSKKRT